MNRLTALRTKRQCCRSSSLRSLLSVFPTTHLRFVGKKGNAAGNRVSITKGGDEGTVTVTYNKDDQVISEKNSKTGDKIKYVYDENGNLTEKRANGKKILYEYDIENRLRSVSAGGQMLMAATYDGDGNKVFQMSRKFVKGEYPKEEDEEDEDPDGEGSASGGFFDPDIFLYGAVQGGMKLSASQSPTLMAAIGHELCALWEGIRTFFTGSYRSIDVKDMAGIVVPGAQRGIFITYDLTYYLNDTNFNENSQVMYQYDQKNREKASYVYGDFDERISADLTRRAVQYVDDKPGDYTYLYDGQGSVTQNLRQGKEARSFDYDLFGKVEEGTEENDVIFGYNVQFRFTPARIRSLLSVLPGESPDGSSGKKAMGRSTPRRRAFSICGRGITILLWGPSPARTLTGAICLFQFFCDIHSCQIQHFRRLSSEGKTVLFWCLSEADG